MKKLFFLLLLISTGAFAQSTVVKKSPYLGLNGEFSSLEITHYTGGRSATKTKAATLGTVSKVEVYTFNVAGLLTERRAYPNRLKKILMEKDTYKYDAQGFLIEAYVGFNLNDKHYISESLWRVIKQNNDTTLWQNINENDWWGTGYAQIVNKESKAQINHYVIEKKTAQKTNFENSVEQYNDRGQILRLEKEATSQSNPQNTSIFTYHENGLLIKEELVQTWKNDGTVSKSDSKILSVDKVDAKSNPLQVSDKTLDEKLVYKYTYRLP